MSRNLTDRNNKPFEEGIYFEGNVSEECYKIFKKGEQWMATDGEKEYLLAYPMGMPDSSRMREGEVDASRLVRLPDDRVKGEAYTLSKIVSGIARELTSTGRRLELLTSYEPSLP